MSYKKIYHFNLLPRNENPRNFPARLYMAYKSEPDFLSRTSFWKLSKRDYKIVSAFPSFRRAPGIRSTTTRAQNVPDGASHSPWLGCLIVTDDILDICLFSSLGGMGVGGGVGVVGAKEDHVFLSGAYGSWKSSGGGILKCSYILFSAVNTSRTTTIFVKFLGHIFSRFGPWEDKMT